MKYLVVDVAAEHGGALTVLRSFVEAASRTDHEWLFYVSTPPASDQEGMCFRRFPWVKRSWLHRLWFDIVVMPREARKERPAAVLSLQNLVVRGWRGPQIVYLHQSLPFSQIKYQLHKHPKLWAYQNLISRLIHSSARRAQLVIVQAAWVRRALLSWRDIDQERVVVVRPERVPIDSSTQRAYDPTHNRTFFYPANAEPYKNHRVILEACEVLEAHGLEFEVVLTVTPEQLGKIWKRDLPRSVRGTGRLTPKQVQSLYARSILIFPSLLESSPLPLSEASAVGGIVIVSDLPFSREVVAGYPNAHFFSPDSAKELADLMAASIARSLDYVEHTNLAPQEPSGFAEVIRLVEETSRPQPRTDSDLGWRDVDRCPL